MVSYFLVDEKVLENRPAIARYFKGSYMEEDTLRKICRTSSGIEGVKCLGDKEHELPSPIELKIDFDGCPKGTKLWRIRKATNNHETSNDQGGEDATRLGYN